MISVQLESITIGDYYSTEPKQFGSIHAIACPSDNTLYVAELLNWRVQKLILHPEQPRASSH